VNPSMSTPCVDHAPDADPIATGELSHPVDPGESDRQSDGCGRSEQEMTRHRRTALHRDAHGREGEPDEPERDRPHARALTPGTERTLPAARTGSPAIDRRVTKRRSAMSRDDARASARPVAPIRIWEVNPLKWKCKAASETVSGDKPRESSPSLDRRSQTAPTGRNTWAASKLRFEEERTPLRCPAPVTPAAATNSAIPNQPRASAPAAVPTGTQKDTSTSPAATGSELLRHAVELRGSATRLGPQPREEV
jgi:hypothetical protein